MHNAGDSSALHNKSAIAPDSTVYLETFQLSAKARGLVSGVATRLRVARPAPAPADGRSANVSQGRADSVSGVAARLRVSAPSPCSADGRSANVSQGRADSLVA